MDTLCVENFSKIDEVQNTSALSNIFCLTKLQNILQQSQNSSAYGWKIVNYLYQAWLFLYNNGIKNLLIQFKRKNLTSLFLMSKYVRNAMIQRLKKVFLTDFVISGCSFLETSKRNGDENWNVSELLSFDTYGFLIHYVIFMYTFYNICMYFKYS